MTTLNTKYIALAADIYTYGKPCGFHDYVENIIEPNKNDAADYYGIPADVLVEQAYSIACKLAKENTLYLIS